MSLNEMKGDLIKTKVTVAQVEKKVVSSEVLFRQAEKEHINHVKNLDHLKSTLRDLRQIHKQKLEECEALDSELFSSSQKVKFVGPYSGGEAAPLNHLGLYFSPLL
jgi:hypothetical protein